MRKLILLLKRCRFSYSSVCNIILNNKRQGWLKIKSNLLAPSPKADRPARRKKNRNIRVSELK